MKRRNVAQLIAADIQITEAPGCDMEATMTHLLARCLSLPSRLALDVVLVIIALAGKPVLAYECGTYTFSNSYQVDFWTVSPTEGDQLSCDDADWDCQSAGVSGWPNNCN